MNGSSGQGAGSDPGGVSREEVLNPNPPLEMLPAGKTTIGVCQISCGSDKKVNFQLATSMFERAASKNVSMIFFPEGFDYIGDTKQQTIELAETLNGPVMTLFMEFAKLYKMWVSLGGFHERSEEKKPDGTSWITNDHVLINPDGGIAAVYRKLHLFDLDIPEKNLRLKESSYVKSGNQLVLTEMTPIGRIGLGICYDLRFPEFAMTYRRQGAHVLTYPSAFTVVTGEAHWESLLRSRAIENQCFVIAAAQYGQHNEKRASYGHSMIIDPWGRILAQGSGSTGDLLCADIDLSVLQTVRRDMPVEAHRVPGISSVLAVPSYRQDSHEQPSVTEVRSLALGEVAVPTDVDTTFNFGPHITTSYKYVFLENRNARALVNRKCVAPGHVLVLTKRMAKRLEDLLPDEVADLFILAQKVEVIIEDIHNVKSSTITVQDGKDAGQTVEHVHCHVVPRTKEDFDNDTIYQTLATHDKGPDVIWRPYSDMEIECKFIRAHILEHFSDMLISKKK